MVDSYSFGGKWLRLLSVELGGSDRACAVLAGAVLDDRLKSLLTGYLVPPVNPKEDRLLGRSGALESFSARIELAFRLALITREVRDALDWVRDIRNDAAHSEEFSFSSNQTRDRVRNIDAAARPRTPLPTSLIGEFGDTPKGHFVADVMMLVIALEIEATESGRTKHEPLNVLGSTVVWSDVANVTPTT